MSRSSVTIACHPKRDPFDHDREDRLVFEWENG